MSEYLIFAYSGSQAGSHERRLLNDLMNSYQKLGRRQTCNKKPCRVQAGLAGPSLVTLFTLHSPYKKYCIARHSSHSINLVFKQNLNNNSHSIPPSLPPSLPVWFSLQSCLTVCKRATRSEWISSSNSEVWPDSAADYGRGKAIQTLAGFSYNKI